ncbi:hypothetical protein AMST5_00622 [freshwater sediment metagenome]|uniref:Chemotaxis protein CheW n=1 Tax=freshwater sediment metagenome TaxID=556182 RepID=A0AA48RBZ8_9ZZZZ
MAEALTGDSEDRGSSARRFESETTDLIFNEENNIEDMFLTFGVAGEEYGLGIAFVTEIVGMQRVMQVPDVPKFIKGVINLRGKVIPVMDVRCRFEMPEKPYTERTVIIVLDVDSVPIGLVVDNVSDVLEIPPSHIDPAPKFNSSRTQESLIRGLGKSGDRVAVLLDIRSLSARACAILRTVGRFNELR